MIGTLIGLVEQHHHEGTQAEHGGRRQDGSGDSHSEDESLAAHISLARQLATEGAEANFRSLTAAPGWTMAQVDAERLSWRTEAVREYVGALLRQRAYDLHPSAQSRALGYEAEAEMAREFTTGKAQAVTPEDFNERVKRLLADKPDPRKAEPRGKNYKSSNPFTKS